VSGIYIVFLVVFFFSVFGVAFMLMRYLFPNPVQDRLQRVAGQIQPAIEEARPGTDWVAKVIKISSPLAKLSMPDEGWERSSLRTRFMNAGLRSENAPITYFSIKTALAVAFPVLAWFALLLTGNTNNLHVVLFALLLADSIGFYLPNVVLRQMIKSRQMQIFESTPDALDLMTICIEAGLAMEAAISRVADEMANVEQAMAEELHLVTL
jgi:tight adherence protein C